MILIVQQYNNNINSITINIILFNIVINIIHKTLFYNFFSYFLVRNHSVYMLLSARYCIYMYYTFKK